MKAKDFRKETIVNALRTLDLDVKEWPSSFFRYIGGVCIGSGFFLGREALYGSIFDEFLKRNRHLFLKAPLVVLQTFNAWVKTLFSHYEPRLLDESIGRTVLTPEQKILKKGEQSKKRLLAFAKRAAQQADASFPITEPVAEEEPEEEISGLGFKAVKRLFVNKAVIDESIYSFFDQLSEDGVSIDKDCLLSIEETSLSFSQYTRNSLSLFPTSTHGPFIGLLKQAETLPQLLHLTDQELETFLNLPKEERQIFLQQRVTEQKKPFEVLTKKATDLKGYITEIDDDREILKKMLAPFLQKKDTKQKIDVLQSELTLLAFNPKLLEATPETLEAEIQERRKKIKTLRTNFEKDFQSLLIYTHELELKADEIRWNIIFSRWEIFSKKVPYNDLSELVERVRSDLVILLKTSVDDLLSGKSLLAEISGQMYDAAYAHNLKLARGEMLARSLRLKDIREEVNKELFSLDQSLCLTHHEDVAQKILEKRSWLYHFFQKLTSPFSIFQNTFDPESINVLFRYFWIDLDRWRRDSHIVQKPTINLSHVYEHMEKLSFEKDDAWSSLIPFISLLPYGEREKKLIQLKALNERKKELVLLAKAVQSVKTFEPERIDALLEAISLLKFPEELFSTIDSRLAAIESILTKIEEEIFCELSFLDERGRFAPGFAITELQSFVTPHFDHIASHIETSFQHLKNSKDEFTSIIATRFEQELSSKAWMKGEFFEVSHKIGRYILYKRLLENGNTFSKALLLPYILNQFISKESLLSHSHELFTLFYPEFSREKIIYFLKELLRIGKDEKLSKACGLLQTELEKADAEIEPPLLTFVPGDLSFFK